jgi:hypothetical protein
MRRAGFNASPREIERILGLGYEAALDELINYGTVANGSFEEELLAKNYNLVRENPDGDLFANLTEMQRWWFYRMVNNRNQLVEKMTLFWLWADTTS